MILKRTNFDDLCRAINNYESNTSEIISWPEITSVHFLNANQRDTAMDLHAHLGSLWLYACAQTTPPHPNFMAEYLKGFGGKDRRFPSTIGK